MVWGKKWKKIEHKGKQVTPPHKNLSNGSKSMVESGNSSVLLGKGCIDKLTAQKSKLSDIRFDMKLTINKLATSDNHLRNIYVLVTKTFVFKFAFVGSKIYVWAQDHKKKMKRRIPKGIKMWLIGACKSLDANLSMFQVCK